MMTKKDFIALADAIRDHDARADFLFDIEQLDILADFCRSRNPRFDRERWLGYIRGECGPNGGAIRSAPASRKVKTGAENPTDALISRIKNANDNTLMSWFRELTEDIESQDEFSDNLTGVTAERGLVRQEIVRRMQEEGSSA